MNEPAPRSRSGHAPRTGALFASVLATVLALPATAQAPASFESPQIHPIGLSADGLRLYVVNTPDHRLSVYDLRTPRTPVLLREIEVGLEPVSVRARTPDEVWVVCHLADAVSVVDTARGVVVATLQTDDEPSDVVFAGGRAFVSTATRRKVEVFDATTRQRIGSVAIFGDEPRALAVSRDGTKVFAAVHRSGNDTTVVPEAQAPPQPPPTNTSLPAPPRTSLIVDSENPQWRSVHGVVLPDNDVVEIDVATLAVTRNFTRVGTILFDVAVHPTTGDLWVPNTEARNLVRFEPVLRGHAIDNRVTRITTGQTPQVTPIDLNPTIDYNVLPSAASRSIALAQPTAAVFRPDGAELYVAAFGTDRIGVLDGSGAVIARIEIGPARGATVDPRNKRGPRGLAHHPTERLLYVHNRLANSLSVVDTVTRTELLELAAMHDPMPAALKQGRGFLYDAKLAGSGTFACAGCHVDAQEDRVAWDLGDPGGQMATVPSLLGPQSVHPMKGPMTTQTLQGLLNTAPFHWRGDRAQFQSFNPAFDKLMGGAQVASTDMDAYTAFIDSVRFPPNPNQNRDRTLSNQPPGSSPLDGEFHYVTEAFRSGLRCVDCHSLGTGTNRLIIPGSVLQESQPFKVPQLRNAYKKDGRKPVGGQRSAGFGFLHDGSIDSVFHLLSMPVFGTLSTDSVRKTRLMAFVESFDTGLAPTVGFQRTLDQGNRTNATIAADLALLIAQAERRNCDLAVHGAVDGAAVGYAYDAARRLFDADRASESAKTFAQLDQLVAQGRAVLTFVGTVPGEGQRVGRDRDRDGRLDRDEGLESYGAGTVGCALVLGANSDPKLGNAQFALVCDGAPANAIGALAVSFARGSLSVLGVELLVDLTLGVAVDVASDPRGVAVVPLALGTDPRLVGRSLHCQAVFVAACGPQGVGASNGLTLTIGN